MFNSNLLESIKPSDVEGTYFGKAGKCCCGCSGTHTKGNKALAAKILKKMRANADTTTVDLPGNYIGLELDGHYYQLTFNDA